MIARFYESDRFSILLKADNRKTITGKNTLLVIQSKFHGILIYINQYYMIQNLIMNRSITLPSTNLHS